MQSQLRYAQVDWMLGLHPSLRRSGPCSPGNSATGGSAFATRASWIFEAVPWIAEDSSWIVEVARWIVKASPWIAEADTWIAKADLWIAKADTWIAKADTWIAKADSWIVEAVPWIATAVSWIVEAIPWIAKAASWIVKAVSWIAKPVSWIAFARTLPDGAPRTSCQSTRDSLPERLHPVDEGTAAGRVPARVLALERRLEFVEQFALASREVDGRFDDGAA